MSLRIGDEAPNFQADTTQGKLDFHQWIGDGWAILFSHPKDFTPVCTTELGYMAKLAPEFAKRSCKVIGLSVDPVADHQRWAKDIEETQGTAPNYPIIGDSDLNVAKLYDMLHPNALPGDKPRTAADNATVRSVFVVGPDKKIKLDADLSHDHRPQLRRGAARARLASSSRPSTRWPRPVNWKQGEDVIIVAAVSDEEAKQKYPEGWKSPKPYLRIVPQPK